MSGLRNWHELAAESMREAQAAPKQPVIPAREVADVLADLRTEFQPVRMAVRVRAKVEALLDEISNHSGA